jgi:phosphoenolpyruvate synthase/pyruvate phosphate dikinase
MVDYIIDQNQEIDLSEDELLKLVGGKGLSLIKLTKFLKDKSNNYIVPYFKIITTKFFEDFILKDEKIKDMISSIDSDVFAKAEKIKELIKEKFYQNESISDVLKNAYINDKVLAIRSSAIAEDSLEKSYAGQMESFLYIKDYKHYQKACLNCLLSIFSLKAINYKLHDNRDPFQDSIAIIIQEMIDPEVSGVMFTFDPINFQDVIVINSVFGIGQDLVSGKLNSDNYFIFKENKKIVSCHLENPENPTLDEYKILNLAEISIQIENYYKKPVDIEFCIKNNNIYILQARYITNVEIGDYRIWDNSNIVESYPGITTPLTFSFIRKAYKVVYEQFCELMGLSKKVILSNRYLFDNMLGFIYYRVYYNLLSWYKLLSLLPYFNQNKEFMEDMMGVKQRLKKDIIPKNKNNNLLTITTVFFRFFFNFVTLKYRIQNFLKNFYKIYENYLNLKKENKIYKMSVFELFDIYKELEEKILFNWKAPIINDLYVMICFGLLKKINKLFKIDENTHLQLLSNTGMIQTTLPIQNLLEITTEIKNKNLSQLFLETQDILKKYKNKDKLILSDDLKEIFDKIDQYIKLYGSRVAGELKLETKTLEDDPSYLFFILKNYIDNKDKSSLEDNLINENQKNNKEIINQNLTKLRKELGVFKYWIYKVFLDLAKWTMKNREDQRLARSQAYSIVRDIVKAVSKKWVKKGIINSEDDIFFLEWDEIWDYAFGKSPTIDLKELIKIRKQEFQKYKEIEIPERFETFSEVYISIKPFKQKIEDSVLRGVVACSGKVIAKVKVVTNLDQISEVLGNLNGEILVAKFTDPGWTLLFPSISGLIIEKGSILSHTAIVAREMGIPTIVGVKNACQVLKDGDLVELDAFSGTIKIIENQKK